MATVRFAPALARQSTAQEALAPGSTIAAVLEAVFSSQPSVRGYVLDDQGALRKHVAIFINGECIRDRTSLADPVPAGAQIYVMQSLSGG